MRIAAKKAATELGLKPGYGAAIQNGAVRLATFSTASASGSLAEKQSALASLAALEDAGAGTLLNAWLDKLVAGTVEKELRLDVIEAVQKSQSLLMPTVTEKLKKFEAARDAQDALGDCRPLRK